MGEPAENSVFYAFKIYLRFSTIGAVDVTSPGPAPAVGHHDKTAKETQFIIIRRQAVAVAQAVLS